MFMMVSQRKKWEGTSTYQVATNSAWIDKDSYEGVIFKIDRDIHIVDYCVCLKSVSIAHQW